MLFKRLYSFSFSFLMLVNFAIGQQPKLMLPIGHTDGINSAQFSPDGKKIVTASQDNTAKIWDAQTGTLIANLIGHSYQVYSAQFNLDGTRIVTISYDSTIKIWDALSGKILIDLKGYPGFAKVNFSPDGKKIIAACYDNTAKIFDATSGILIANLIGHGNSISSIQFSQDGKRILTASLDDFTLIWDASSGNRIIELNGHSDGIISAQFSQDGKKIVTISFDSTLKVWDAVSGKLIVNLKGQTEAFSSAEFSPDGKKIATTSQDDSTVKIWGTITGIHLFTLKGHTELVYHAQFSPDGEKIITNSKDYTAKIWNASSGSLITDFQGHNGNVTDVEFSSDGKKIVTACEDGTAKIWNVSSGSLIADLKGHTNEINYAQFSPDGKKIITVSEHNNIAEIWDAELGNIIADLDRVYSARFSPDAKRIVTASEDSTAKIWNAISGNLIASLKGHMDDVASAQFSPDGKKIVTASYDNTAKIWDAVSGKLIADLKEHSRQVKYAEFSPDGEKIVTTSFDDTCKIWDATSGNLIANLKGHMFTVPSAQFSPDGKKIVIASGDSTAKIWDAASGHLITNLKGHMGDVASAQFSPDGKKIVSASWDKTAKIWDAVSGKTIADLKGHKQQLCSAKFSPDGKKIVTASYDNTAKIWDAVSGKLIADLKGHSRQVNSAEFSPDGEKIVTTSSDNTCKIWNTKTGENLYTFFTLNKNDYLVVDKSNHYDGTEAARKLLYFTCGTEVIELDQVKDQLWVPNLAERILKGDTINAKTLNELNICGLIPEVEDGGSKAGEFFFKITPRRGGLGETILSINGTPTKTYKPEQLKKNGGVYELIINKDELSNYFIAGAENQVTVKAYTSDNAISSRGLIIKEDKTKEATTPPNLYAVMIGVSDYKGDELDLKFAAKDASDISAAVATAAKKLLNTDSKEHVFMYNLTTAKEHYQLPEKNSIKKVLEEIGKKATANDILLIFFAGHGVMQGDKKQFYFLTADASKASALDAIADVGISTAELTEWMKPQNIKAQKRILIFDACNSGQAIKDFVKMGKEDQGYLAARNDDKAQQIKAIDKLNEKSGLFILSASASNQSAYEMGRYSQGLLTYSLLKAIKQQPDILEDGKYLNVSRWFNAAEKTVSDLSKENGARQEPQIVSNTNFNIGVVDDDVMAKIVLPQEKPLFAASNFQNADENIMADDLGLNKLTDQQLNEIAARGADATISYMSASNLPDAYSLTGRYTLTGNNITMRVIIRKNNEVKYRFELPGTKDKLNDLAKSIVAQAADWAAKNK